MYSDALGVNVSHIGKNSAFFLTQLHNRPHILGRRIYERIDNRLLHVLYICHRRQLGRVVNFQNLTVRRIYLVRNARRRGNQIEVELPFETFLNYFHVQQP